MSEIQNTNKSVENHYTRPNMLEAILDALKKSGKDVNRLTAADLAMIDAFHIRGREATAELAGRTRLEPGSRVLDVGCGVGGSSRYLASAHQCRVTGIDLTREFVETARALTKLTGLEKSVEFHHGSALETPFDDGTFDVAWTEHVQMNIQDKRAFYAEMARVLKSGGRFLFHDVFQGPGGDPQYPLPWANEPSVSFLAGIDTARQILSDVGFTIQEWEDRSDESLKWFAATIERFRTAGSPPIGPQLVMGESAAAKFQNIADNLRENRLAVVQAVASKS